MNTLHLYIGMDCLITQVNIYRSGAKYAVGDIIKLTPNYYKLAMDDYLEVKPILTPLKDMLYNDMVKLIAMECDNPFKITSNAYSDRIEYKQAFEDVWVDTGLQFDMLNFEQMYFLLSNGYDIEGRIKNGDALEKNKVDLKHER